MPSPKWDLHVLFGPVEEGTVSKQVEGEWVDEPAWVVVTCIAMSKNGKLHHIIYKSANKFRKTDWVDFVLPVTLIGDYPTPPFVLKLLQPFIDDPAYHERMAEPEYEEEEVWSRKTKTWRKVRRLNVGRAAIARWTKRGRPIEFNEDLTSRWYIRQGLNSW